MNSIRQWLLIGGPQHGKVIWAKGGVAIIFEADDCKQYRYEPKTFAMNGMAYQIGEHDAAPGQYAEVGRLICELNLQGVPLDRPGFAHQLD